MNLQPDRQHDNQSDVINFLRLVKTSNCQILLANEMNTYAGYTELFIFLASFSHGL